MKKVDLKQIVICKVCQTPHRKRPLAPKESAHCIQCGARIYRSSVGVEYRFFSFALSALLIYVGALLFPIVTLTFQGLTSETTIVEAIKRLALDGYWLVAFFVFLVLVVYPILFFVSALLASLLITFGGCRYAKRALTVVTMVSEWSMADIFFVAILVAMVKVFEYAQITFGVAFVALGLSVVLQLYMVRFLGVESLWERWEERCDTV